MKRGRYCGTRHDELTGTWELPNKSWFDQTVVGSSTYGTPRMGALTIIERTLNMKSVTVMDEVECLTNKSGVRRVINKDETTAAIEKQKNLIRLFRDWIWKGEDRKKELVRIFEEKYGCLRRRIFVGDFLEFPGMSGEVTLCRYQKNAVARILLSPNTLLAHDVGAGKTYVMVAAGMELLRMGLSKKNLYVVPNHIVGQWQSIFLSMYPWANVLVVEPKVFRPAVRRRILEKMRDGSYDAVLIAYSCFEKIPLSKEYRMRELEEQKAELAAASKNYSKATSRLKGREASIARKLAQLAAAQEKTQHDIFFDEMGFTRMFVDEAHNFKNVPLDTKVDHVLGISCAGSGKCKDMMQKVHMIQKMNGGGGVVMATGTPITNSITDAFIMQMYLQSGELKMMDLANFDSWIGMFAERVTEFEVDVDTSAYRLTTRFSKFHNLPELTTMLSEIADFYQPGQEADLPLFEDYTDCRIPRTLPFKMYLETITERAEAVRQGGISRKEDNMLKITTDGRKAALDLRLVDPEAGYTCQSKVAVCASQAANVYFATKANRSTQLIFCDSSTPKDDFNMYDEMRRELIQLGVKPEEIAYVHDAHTEKARMALFRDVQQGKIRILLGSTAKLGLGVNVQDRLIAVHHLDIPWRPADMTQREGRILRQGNTNERIWIFRYITEGSFDAYSWQLLHTKQRFIADLLSGSVCERSRSDIENTVLSYAEVKALAIGNKLVKKRVEMANELARYQTLQRKAAENRLHLERLLCELPEKIARYREDLENTKEDMTFYGQWKRSFPAAKTTRERDAEAMHRRCVREAVTEALTANGMQEREQELMAYRGFALILPSNMTPSKPFVWLGRTGRYYVELSDSEVGNLSRIDHVLEKLPELYTRKKKAYLDLIDRRIHIHAELASDVNYTEQIERARRNLKAIDKELGLEVEAV